MMALSFAARRSRRDPFPGVGNPFTDLRPVPLSVSALLPGETRGGSGCKSSSSVYDKLGDATSTAYPVNNFTVTYGYDAAARLTSASDSSGVTYAQAPTFLASGAIQEFASPNFNNNKFHADYNSRLQPTEIWAGPSAGANALFDKKYSYNAPSTSQMNNGNVYTVTNMKDDSRTQSFTYDSLNRLLSA